MKFFTADGKEVSTVVRGENYISVIDPATFRDVRRIETTRARHGGVSPDGKLAFVVSSFAPVAEVVDVKTHKVIKRLPVVSPFSPFLQFTPDYKEVWMTHKDVGKITRIDTDRLEATSPSPKTGITISAWSRHLSRVSRRPPGTFQRLHYPSLRGTRKPMRYHPSVI
jgi:DNA-binding beta-propeller fold protein YncE